MKVSHFGPSALAILFTLISPSLADKKENGDNKDYDSQPTISTLTITQNLGTLLSVPSATTAGKPVNSGVIGDIKLGKAAGSASQSFLSDGDFQSSVLNSTNTIRRQHNATALTWNTTLVNYAQAWSKKCRLRDSVSLFEESII
jgi:uncharacterized protein YkwD